MVSRYGGEVNAPPILYDQVLFREVARMRARAGCGREVVRRHHDRAVRVDWPAARLRDLDRPGDYEAVREELDRAAASAGAEAGAGPEEAAGAGAPDEVGAASAADAANTAPGERN